MFSSRRFPSTMTALIVTLLALPLVTGLLLAVVSHKGIRDWIVRVASVLLILLSVAAFVVWHRLGPISVDLHGEGFTIGFFAVDVIITAYILYLSVKHRKYFALVLTVIQFLFVVGYEIMNLRSPVAGNTFYIDDLSLIMVLVAGGIGSLIALFSIGYMKSYQFYHGEVADRRRLYYFLVFLFLSAMLGLVLANDLGWLFFFWEITTFCSFMLIGYTQSKQAIDNSFLALVLNLIGGIAFILALIYLKARYGIVDMTTLLATGKPLILLPVALLGIAGITKAALLPFSSWLLGAMVAPTTVSALLHSSTMVKAGVYLLLRLAPVFQGTYVGYAVAFIGGITFLIASVLAVSQSDAKRVLAYSTIANLGLIAACAGIGNYELLWVGIFVIIFHAVAKSLLFLSVGVVGYKLHSVEIEDMDNLVVRFPMLTLLILVGISGMFIAPFGMLISKWAALQAFISLNSWVSLVLIACVAYGSAATLFFWTKWMGKIVSVNRARWTVVPDDKLISGSEWIGLWVLGILTLLVVLLFPLESSALVSPYVQQVFGIAANLEGGNYVTTAVMLAIIVIIPLFLLAVPRKTRSTIGPVYMAGRDSDEALEFKGTFGRSTPLVLQNYYLRNLINEKLLTRIGVVVGIVLTLFVVGAAFL